MRFVVGVNFGDSPTLMQLVLSLKNWKDIFGVGICTEKKRRCGNSMIVFAPILVCLCAEVAI